MMSKPRSAVLCGAALYALILGVAPASAGPSGAHSRAYQAWLAANALKMPRAISGGKIASANPAPDAGAQTVTTSENDTDNDGIIDERSIETTNFDKKGRVVRTLQEYDSNADGTVEASTLVTTEYDKSGNAIRQVSVSNVNDLGSGGDGSVFRNRHEHHDIRREESPGAGGRRTRREQRRHPRTRVRPRPT